MNAINSYFSLKNNNGLFVNCSKDDFLKKLNDVKKSNNCYLDIDFYFSSDINSVYFFEVFESKVNMFGSISFLCV